MTWSIVWLKNELTPYIDGMSVTNPLKEDIKYINGEFKRVELDYNERIEKENKKAFQSYAWGVWITAWTRYKLERALTEIGAEYVYCDTDSVKFEGSRNLDKLNAEYIKKAEERGAFADDPNGKRHYMGVFEREKPYALFKTLGAKRYAFEYADGEKGVTISGVNKSEGARELWSRGGLKAFNDGFVFRKAGGTESIYHDKLNQLITLDGRPFRLTNNVTIVDSTYTLGITGEYLRIMQHPDMWYNVIQEL